MLQLLVGTSKHECGLKSDHVLQYERALGDYLVEIVR